MKQSVKDQFTSFSQPFEGILDFMYLDVKGLVTIGMGNLLDSQDPAQSSPAQAQILPFFFKDDPSHLATASDIADDWQRVKARQDLAPNGGGAFKNIALLRISRQAIDDLVASRLTSNEGTLKTGTAEFGGFDNWPADAQLGLHSMAWAMGAAFAQGGRWPAFRAACAIPDFDQAAQASKMDERGNPGLVPRNRADVILFTNAARVLDGSAPDPSPDTLWYPQILTPGVPPVNGTQPSGGWPVLKQGDSIPLVTTLQFLLNEHGATVATDGNFDATIDAAVKTFQTSSGLNVDGQAGQNTWESLIVQRSFGQSGDAVSAIQDRLLIFDVGLVFPTQGEFEAVTDTAVRTFQQASSLTADGVVGHDTWHALISL